VRLPKLQYNEPNPIKSNDVGNVSAAIQNKNKHPKNTGPQPMGGAHIMKQSHKPNKKRM
jgi:hypothetical protein